ncbi:copper-binding protein [Bordetella petrii]|uniref:copper-binding protein n=1 Tax=Bordetella petrii TaxID=94624 RepID=UPI001E3525A0|nr:copper-binding protein [Bordetella petrii]MCD0504121.1 copper-binding protein [Bordetella petrii]
MKNAYKAVALALAVAGLAAWAALPARAQAVKQEAAATASASGEVRRVDSAGGKVTIKHGEISALDLPAMTLVYQADPALLANIKPGDNVRFTATRKDGRYVVTEISK